jgi:hypothetical protein
MNFERKKISNLFIFFFIMFSVFFVFRFSGGNLASRQYRKKLNHKKKQQNDSSFLLF